MDIVTRAANQAGGWTKLARCFRGRNGKPLTPQGLKKWAKHGVPSDRIQEFSDVTGFPPSRIRPDLAALFVKDRAA